MIEKKIIEPSEAVQSVVIWMHGLGASADDMIGLAQAVNIPHIRHISLQAPMRPVTINAGMVMPAWYDIVGVKITDREDEAGILQSAQTIRSVISTELEKGIHSKQIFLAGFSQGGAMALWTSLTSEYPLGGVIALSAYLPIASRCQITLPKETPIFIGMGLHDPIVLPQWTEAAVNLLKLKSFSKVSTHVYPMEHAVCIEEIRDITQWLRERSAV